MAESFLIPGKPNWRCRFIRHDWKSRGHWNEPYVDDECRRCGALWRPPSNEEALHG